MPDNSSFSITREGSRIVANGRLRSSQMRYLFAAMHRTINNLGYQDIELDFSGLTATFPSPMLALASQCQLYLKRGIDTHLILPEDESFRRLFLNTNWANFIDPVNQPPSTFKGHTQIPAIKYSDALEQFEIVQNVLGKMLSRLSDFNRSHLAGIEWCINEITDNVLNHSQSEVGGLVQVTNFRRNRRAVEFAVCDAGIGIPETLRSGHPDLQDDASALDRAIREGVTRGEWVGQGNGLYGSCRIAELSRGTFEIHSGYASMFYEPKAGFHFRNEEIPFKGTLVAVSVGYENPLILEEALNFQGRGHTPVDYIELVYDEDEQGNVVFVLQGESSGFGSREAGRPVRTKLLNLLDLIDGKIRISFEGVPLISSSYADEVFGKIFVEVGALEFANRFEFTKVEGIVRRLIDRSISQRMQASMTEDGAVRRREC